MTPRRAVRILWRRKLVCLIVFALVAVTGTGVLLSRHKVYQSTSSVALLPVSSNSSVLPNYPNLIASLIPTYVQLVSSPLLLREVATRLPFSTTPAELANDVHAESLSSAAVISIVAQRPNPVQARELAAATTAAFLSSVKGNGVVIPKIYAQPTTPKSPAMANRKIVLASILALAIIVGLAAGLAWDRLFGSGDDDQQSGFDQAGRPPVLGTLPWPGGQAGDAGGAIGFGSPGSGDSRWALDDWRALRAGFMRRTAHLMRSVTVTSLTPGAGATAVAAHLAASLAEVGLAVALVDADVRHPALDGFFGLENERGLTSTVLSGADPATLLHPAPTAPGLHVVPAGPPLPSPRIEADMYRQQLPRFTSLVDMVIVDAPALGGESDAVAIASATEGVVLVIPSEADQLEHLEAARRVLTRSGALLVGMVLTGRGAAPGGSGTAGDISQQAAYGSARTARSQAQ
ncbi:MAG TPA: hypothetical protein VGI64_10460 [Streptosporangiaceae bacterium]|jgi:capsular exopolysaccharide synthesis family protein